jgi:hypothetical protein
MLKWIGSERCFSFVEFCVAETTNMLSANDIVDSEAVSYLGSNAHILFMIAKPNINYS